MVGRLEAALPEIQGLLDDERVRGLGAEARLAYARLLAHHWREGSIPADADSVRSIAGVEGPERPEWTAALLARLGELFPESRDGGARRHDPRWGLVREELDRRVDRCLEDAALVAGRDGSPSTSGPPPSGSAPPVADRGPAPAMPRDATPCREPLAWLPAPPAAPPAAAAAELAAELDRLFASIASGPVSPRPGSTAAGRATGDARVDWDALRDRWNRIAGRFGRPTIRAWTEGRKRHVRARLARHPRLLDEIEDEMPRLAARVRESRWLSLDWLAKSETNLMKFLEGHYREAPRRFDPLGRRSSFAQEGKFDDPRFR